MGFIGRNGAGKTTTLKSLLNLVHPDSGDIRFFGLPWADGEMEIKRRIGFAAGGVNYYPMKPLSVILRQTAAFYPNWDDAACRRYLALFALDGNKKLKELSEGMKVKFALTLALSHRAEVLLLDEPTSGLDPVSRDELLRVFRDLAAEGIAILFSTHITSDLDRCADDITYIRAGEIVASAAKDDFVSQQGGGTLEDIMLRIERGGEHT
jgi:ABC-2 type transport system ATP-binding protein